MSPAETVGLGRRILLVEDDPYLSTLVEQVLTSRDFVVCVAPDAAEGYEAARDFDPDQALIDVMLGEGPTGVDLAYSLTAKMPWIALVLVTSIPDLAAAGLPQPPPGTGLVHKSQVTDVKVLLDVMETSLTGNEVPFLTTESPFRNLTRSQMAVLRLMAQGYSNEAIAAQRNCTKSAVEYQVNGVFRGLGIVDRPEINRRTEAVRIYLNAVGPTQRRTS